MVIWLFNIAAFVAVLRPLSGFPRRTALSLITLITMSELPDIQWPAVLVLLTRTLEPPRTTNFIVIDNKYNFCVTKFGVTFQY